MESSTILIAGSSGFIGKYIVNALSYMNLHFFSRKCTIIAVDNSEPDKKDFIDPDNITFIKHDISKPLSIGTKIDYVIHAASIASPIVYRKYPLETIDVNVTGTRNILDLAKTNNVKSILYLSSSEVYGDPPDGMIPTKEDYKGNVSFTGPRACYDESKRLGETLCTLYFQKHGVPVKTARPFNVYGPGLKPDDGRVVPDFIRDAVTKKKIILYSDGKPTRSFCYISDAVKAFFRILLMAKNGEAFNVGNNHEVSMHELALTVGRKTGADITFEKHPEKAYTTDNPQRRCPDLSKIHQLGYVPRVSLEKGIGNMIDFYSEILKKVE